MEMERVAFCAENASVLQHKLNACIERKHHHLRTIVHKCVVRRGTRIIEWNERLVRELSGVHTIRLPKEVGLEESRGGQYEGHIVDRRGELGPIGPLASLVLGARVRPQSYSEEEVFIDSLRDICWKLSIG